MSHNIDYSNRVPASFYNSKVEEILPEHFTTDYPNLVEFLKEYYRYLEKDDEGFTYLLGTLYQARDMNTSLLSQLDNLFSEVGLGLKASDFNINPRLIAKLFANFYREKGSANSAKLFFRGLYDAEIEIEYPKNNMFIVNESQLGPQSLRYIQNDERYQIHSILIKSGLSITKWEALYKRLVHPAGFYLSGDVFITSVGNLNIGDMPISIEVDPALLGTVQFEGTNDQLGINGITEVITTSATYDNNNVDPNRILQDVEFISGTIFDDQYSSFLDFIDTNYPTFDTETDPQVDFSNTLETMDQV